MTDIHRYDEIINLPRHVSEKHPPLGKESYAAQFSPFESLTGYEDVVEEAARATDNRVYLDEDEKIRLSEMLTEILKHSDDKPEVTITYFVADGKKDGGKFATVKGTIKKYREFENKIILDDGTVIATEDITDIKCDLF